eukprot:CAMPEP_0196593796 /NCGR_PEP_ID=MMETSP1081-20130531/76607_1 /TAXON_ID=36882 /ORGANISM="Pyramimonas amylifera, Strain CCMP720" /LENGTH=316 /DNA_ID=CAMNT_0041917883 /DNA_START=293 /DNA_END=1243 /DNA_ORIENTATION=-
MESTASKSKEKVGMSSEEKFIFDTNGYLVVKGVLSPGEVKSANAAIDAHSHLFKERTGKLRNTVEGTPLGGDGRTGRSDVGGFLEWQPPHRDVFRSILAHPALIPYIHELCGEGYRLDHSPLIFTQRQGSEGFSLHGGPVNAQGQWDPILQYQCQQGRLYTNLLAVSVQLTDINPGDGGFCIVKGSHKAAFPTPPEMINGLAHTEHVYQPTTSAGDVVIFTEASVHGTLPWTSSEERRIALFRFAPATCGYGRAYYPQWPEKTYEGITEEQRAVLEPPYGNRLDRPKVDADNSVQIQKRTEFKKGFDKEVFGTEYF